MNRRIITLITSLLSIILLLFVSIVYAETETFRATYKYVIGDNDTKNDAKTLCFMGAKRRLLEQVGTFITSKTQVSDFKLTKDEITSYSAAFLKIVVENEKTEVNGETSAIVMTIKTDADLDVIKKILNKIINDASLKLEITEKNKKISLLEERLQNLQKQLASTNYNSSIGLREERKETFENLDIENVNIRRIILAQKKRESERTNIVISNSRKVRTILNYIQCGMTSEEVRELIEESVGDGRSYKVYRRNGSGLTSFWGRLIFKFHDDDYYKKAFLEEITYKDPGHNKCSYVVVKTRKYNILSNYGEETVYYGPVWDMKPKIVKRNKQEIRKRCPEMYKYIWED
jgi:hypothetical protein